MKCADINCDNRAIYYSQTLRIYICDDCARKLKYNWCVFINEVEKIN